MCAWKLLRDGGQEVGIGLVSPQTSFLLPVESSQDHFLALPPLVLPLFSKRAAAIRLFVERKHTVAGGLTQVAP